MCKIVVQWLGHEESIALRELKHDKDVMIVKADKGGATVVLDRPMYDDKMNVMLGDNCTYKKLEKDPTSALQRKMNGRLLQLKCDNELSE